MSSPTPVEEKKPSLWHRPVPLWAFLLLVVLLAVLIVPNLLISLISPPVAISQPLILSQDSRTMYLGANETTVANFTVTDLNATGPLPATVSLILTYFSNSTKVPTTGNVTSSVKGVYTGTSFAAASSGNSVVFQFGGNTLAINITSQRAKSGLYTLTVALSL